MPDGQNNLPKNIHMGYMTVSQWESFQFQKPSAEVTDTIRWIRDYVAQPHAMIGRDGPVCPKVPGALKLDSIYLKLLHESECLESEVESEIQKTRDLFFQFEPVEHPDCVFKALLLLLPAGKENFYQNMVEQIQQTLKPWFLEKGLLLGKFHKNLKTTALSNIAFRPSQSPHSMLAVRYVVPSDIKFILTSGAPATAKLKTMEIFLACFGETLQEAEITTLRDQIKHLQQTIHK